MCIQLIQAYIHWTVPARQAPNIHVPLVSHIVNDTPLMSYAQLKTYLFGKHDAKLGNCSKKTINTKAKFEHL